MDLDSWPKANLHRELRLSRLIEVLRKRMLGVDGKETTFPMSFSVVVWEADFADVLYEHSVLYTIVDCSNCTS